MAVTQNLLQARRCFYCFTALLLLSIYYLLFTIYFLLLFDAFCFSLCPLCSLWFKVFCFFLSRPYLLATIYCPCSWIPDQKTSGMTDVRDVAAVAFTAFFYLLATTHCSLLLSAFLCALCGSKSFCFCSCLLLSSPYLLATIHCP